MNIVLVAHLFFALMKMFVLNPFASIGDLICCGILYFGLARTNFCQLLFYMIFCLFDACELSISIGFMVQTGNIKSDSGFLIFFIVAMFTFYCVAVYMSFQTYKEFKAMHYEQLGDIESMSLARSNPIQYGALRKSIIPY